MKPTWLKRGEPSGRVVRNETKEVPQETTRGPPGFGSGERISPGGDEKPVEGFEQGHSLS